MASKQLKVVYAGDISQVKRALQQMDQAHTSFGSRLSEVSSKLQNVGKSMYRTGRTVTTGLTLPLVGFGKVAIDEFTQFQQVNAQTQSVLKSTGDASNTTQAHIQQLSKTIGDLSAQDGEAVQGTENLLLTFTKIRNEVGKGNDIFDQASLAVANMSARFSQDGKSSAIQLGKALNDPVAGLTSLTRIGIQFSAHEKQLIAQAVKHNNVLAAQKVILGEVNKQTAGAAAAAGKTASPFTKISLAFRDFAQAVGQVLSPILEKLVPIIQKVADWFANLSPHTQKLIVLIGILAAVFGPVLIILGAIITAIGALISPITLVVAGIALLVVAWMKFRRVTAIVLTALFPIIGVIRLIVEHWQGLKEATFAVWHAIADVVRTAWKAISGVVKVGFKVLSTVVKVGLKVIWTIWSQVWQNIKGVLMVVWKAFGPLIKGVFGVIKGVIVGGLRTIKGVWTDIWHAIKTVFSDVWHSLVAVAKPVLNAIITLLNAVIHAINAVIHGYNLIPFHSDLPSIPTIPPLARGGTVTAEGLALVGEHGPELLALARGASVVPLPASGAAARGDTRITVVLDRTRFGRQQELAYANSGR